MSSRLTPSLPEARQEQPYMRVSALESGFLELRMRLFVAGSGPNKSVMSPSLSFSLRHSASGDHLLFDLGIRKKWQTHPPAVQQLNAGREVLALQSVDESLRKGGIEPANVNTVIISHLHWDHVGDTSSFPNATFILGGEAEDLITHAYPSDPDSPCLQTAVPLERARFLNAEFTQAIGPFPRAYDYFGDGSVYIIDAPDHLAGHINVLARTNATGSWIYLAGDSAHDARIITGEREVAVALQPDGHVRCIHSDKKAAEEHIRRVRTLLDEPKVLILLAHDRQWYEDNKDRGVFLPGAIEPQ
ncbi:Metallo-hydrolase/oxidoreductase [Trametes versicolor FP-101664 SS1]|uniref:Metallo-hydrolase/oxidoreductase n=1 Tax=Trametes versicolor (strain FP-101664) TaxID=717944 RepID=UPI00046239CD|nr:Metallo-hydrolase/oxidoreductase [Trametes versicolor FP-101664 SS1]EIW52357.1 Metallo-hydrolase/oxidoreductase [Trametes versicolor FP-101664 SS1]